MCFALPRSSCVSRTHASKVASRPSRVVSCASRKHDVARRPSGVAKCPFRVASRPSRVVTCAPRKHASRVATRASLTTDSESNDRRFACEVCCSPQCSRARSVLVQEALLPQTHEERLATLKGHLATCSVSRNLAYCCTSVGITSSMCNKATTGRLKMRDTNLRHQNARVENARHENAGPICKGGKCGKS